MPTTSLPTQVAGPSTIHRGLKIALWAVMGAMTLSVIFYSEIPLLRKERAYLSTIPFLIVPHIVEGVTALLAGPLQFSSRLRRRSPKFHRVLGPRLCDLCLNCCAARCYFVQPPP
jgi:uncharacterized membrane protein